MAADWRGVNATSDEFSVAFGCMPLGVVSGKWFWVGGLDVVCPCVAEVASTLHPVASGCILSHSVAFGCTSSEP